MGSMADYYMDLAINAGEDPFGFGGDRNYVRSYVDDIKGPSSKHNVTCQRCGTKKLKWRETSQGWRLYTKERGEHNQKLEHQCGTAKESDFEVLHGD